MVSVEEVFGQLDQSLTRVNEHLYLYREWNTCDTGGVCPACLQRWTETQRLSCARWSAHSDWYEH